MSLIKFELIQFTKTNSKKTKNEISEYQNLGKKHYRFWKIGRDLSITLRLIIPLFIFKSPLLTFICFTLVDWYDFNFYMKINFSEAKYNQTDKFLDLYSYFFMTLYAYFYYPGLIFLTLLGFFIFRLVGTVLFWFSNNHQFLFLFPNIVEPLFLSLILNGFLKLNSFQIFTFLLIGKSFQEYFVHIKLSGDSIASILKINFGNIKESIILT